jgi:SAM-dependent methyltransferase
MKNKFKQYSILRQGQYTLLSETSLEGTILDLGGDKRSNYHELIKGNHTITTVNLFPETGCDIIADLEIPLPIKNGSYNNVLALNVLEHIYHFQQFISESYRVLTPQGKIIIAVPFMFQVHGSPHDFFRYTRQSLEHMLKDAGFENINITEIGKGFFSLMFQVIDGPDWIRPLFLKNFFKKICIGLDALLSKIERYKKLSKAIPLGYFVVAERSRRTE